MNSLQNGPDFILGGAMKAGTSTIRRIIEHSEQVFMPEGELFFFDIDDVQQHPDFLCWRQGDVCLPNFQDNPSRYIDWYESFFESAREGQLTGDYSSTYLASHIAPERISALCPSAKIIFSLRDPVERAYSHYWHRMRTGREIYAFEDALRYYPERLLQRSYYKQHLLRYREKLSDNQIKIIIFEELISDMQRITDEIYEFLGLDKVPDVEQIDTHQNPAWIPLFPPINRWINMMLKPLVHQRYSSHLPSSNSSSMKENVRKLYKGFRYITSLRSEKPGMNKDVRLFLEHHLERKNRGLGELIGNDLEQFWPWFEG